MSLKDIKGKIKSVDRTRKVTKAMETVSAVKMRKSQLRAMSGRPYARAALSLLKRLSVSLESVKHPLTAKRAVRRAAYIVVTSDKGLCGVLNSAVLRGADRELLALGLPHESVDLYAFGRKAADFFERRGYKLANRFENISDDVPLDELDAVTRAVTASFAKGDVDQVQIIYTNFKSTFEQFSVSGTILPLSLETVQAIVDDILPDKGAFAERRSEEPSPASFYTIEPSPETVLEKLLPRLAGVLLYHALLESKASEHSARMVAMKNASDKSRDLSKSLTRTYNKARQAMITREVSEIVGGIEAMATN